MVSFNVFLLILAVSGVSSAWSTSINSLFSSRSLKSTGFGIGSSVIESLAAGVQMAMEYCQEKFKWDRWNCPESAFSRRNNQPSTKENAFVLAVTSAGIVHSITKNCSRGEIAGCGCDPKPGEDPTDEPQARWTWGGCSDHLDFGERVAEQISGDLERGIDTQAFINIRNNAIGRMAVRKTMKKNCRCLGVSGSCTLQTCWMQMADFSEVTKVLRKKYDHAVRLDYETGSNKLSIGNAANNLKENIMDQITETNTENLIYLDESPDYCKPNAVHGWNGTLGRTCSRGRDDRTSPAERRSCKNLCRTCGHRVHRDRRVRTKRCNCTFIWCCEVKCDTCHETVEEFYCK